jgi:hypothetical protein
MLGYYRATSEDIEQNRYFAANRIAVLLLAPGGDAGSAPNLFDAMRPLGINVRGGTRADRGHDIPEEQPKALADALLTFFSEVG